MELVLIRHGLPERQVVDDGAADPPLSALGHEQARRVAAWLAHQTIDAVYASTMNRARQTAEPFALEQGLEITEREGVVEYDRQQTSYVPMEELKAQDYEAWRAFVAGGYNDHVDIHQFHATVVNTLEQIVAEHSSQRIAVFCHGGVINVWTAHVLGLTPSMFFEPKYTSIHRYMCARTGERNLLSLNEVAHLRGLEGH